MTDYIFNTQICNELISQAPVSLILYTHIPSAVIAMIIGIFVVSRSKSILGKILFSITLAFSFWTLIDLVVWLSSNSILTMTSWSFFGVITGLIAILSFYFFYVFLFKKDISNLGKVLLLIPMLPLIFLTPSIYNVTHFDLASCEAVENTYFSYYYYALGGLAFIGILFLVMYGWNRVKSMPKKQIVLMATGLELFLASFFSLGLISSYLDNYSIEFYGLFGMVVFVAFLSYLIVKFKAFNIRLIGSQALVWALVILIGSQFFFIQNNINRVLTGITVLLSAFVGLMIVKSVKKEIKQKERIESLADSLRSLNDRLEITNSSLELANERLKELDHMKSEFVSLATHQIRGPLAAIKGYVSLMIEGDYGQVPATFVEPLDTVFKSTDSLSKMVTDFLDVSRIDLGQMKYEFTDFDFRDLVEEVSKELKIGVEAKGLEYKEKITHGKCPVKADRTKLKQVLINLIDNSSKYTEKGGLEVSVEKLKEGNKILFAVKDSGVGISKATLPVLFQRFSRAKNANDVNILGTGLGLYIAKKMVEANHGKIWAESEGEGKGAEFYVELNLVE